MLVIFLRGLTTLPDTVSETTRPTAEMPRIIKIPIIPKLRRISEISSLVESDISARLCCISCDGRSIEARSTTEITAHPIESIFFPIM